MGNQSPCIRLASCAKRARGRTLLASWPGDSRAGRRQPHPLSCCRRRCPHGSSPSCPCDRRRSTLRFRVGHESMRGGGPSVRCRVRSWEETKPANWSSRQELSAIKQAKPARGAPWMFWLPPCAARRLCMLPIQSFGCARRRAARRARSCKAACGERRGGGGGALLMVALLVWGVGPCPRQSSPAHHVCKYRICLQPSHLLYLRAALGVLSRKGGRSPMAQLAGGAQLIKAQRVPARQRNTREVRRGAGVGRSAGIRQG